MPDQPVHIKLGDRRASATLGFHALTGSDMSGRFAGRTKEWCFKLLWPVMMTYLMLWNLYGTESYRKKNMTSCLNDSSANYTSTKYTPK